MKTFKEYLSEAFDLVNITEPRLNKDNIINLILENSKKQGASQSFLTLIEDNFRSYNKLFGYNKQIQNTNLLVFYFVPKEGGTEIHFLDLNNIRMTGEDTQVNVSSQGILSYIMSVAFKLIEDNKPIIIKSPKNNPNRLKLYVKSINYVIKKYNLEVIPLIKDNTITLVHKYLKDTNENIYLW